MTFWIGRHQPAISTLFSMDQDATAPTDRLRINVSRLANIRRSLGGDGQDIGWFCVSKDRLYFRQLSPIRRRRYVTTQMLTCLPDRRSLCGDCVVMRPAYAAEDLLDAESDDMRLSGAVTHHHQTMGVDDGFSAAGTG